MPPAPRILVVDDDRDTCELLVTALSAGGYTVEQAANADEAMDKLRQAPYDLVLTDYDMPGRSGAALLTAARTSGLLDSTLVLMITAHPEPEAVDGVAVLSKPFDIEKLLDQLRQMLPMQAVAHVAPGVNPVATGEPEHPDVAPASPPPDRELLDLVLYAAQGSPASSLARRNLDRALRCFDPGGFRIVVKDLGANAEDAERDRVIFAPTLVKRNPLPRTWLIGDLSDPSVLIEFLECSGLERTG